MKKNRSMPESSIIPELPYSNVREAAEWLRDRFHFKERLKIGEDRAQLVFGQGTIIVIAQRQTAHSPHTVMVRVDDLDGLFSHVQARGVKIDNPPTEYPYGEIQFTAEHLGGHRWTFSQTITDVAPEDWGGELIE